MPRTTTPRAGEPGRDDTTRGVPRHAAAPPPASLSASLSAPQRVLTLQRRAGNAAVTRVLARGDELAAGTPAAIRPAPPAAGRVASVQRDSNDARDHGDDAVDTLVTWLGAAIGTKAALLVRHAAPAPAAAQGLTYNREFAVAATDLVHEGGWTGQDLGSTLALAFAHRLTAQDIVGLFELAFTYHRSKDAVDACLRTDGTWGEFFLSTHEFARHRGLGDVAHAPAGPGGGTVVHQVGPAPAADGSYSVQRVVTAESIEHYRQGHTFEGFKFTEDNVLRAKYIDFWESGTDIAARAVAALASPEAAAAADDAAWGRFSEGQHAGDRFGFAPYRAEKDGLYVVEMTRLYPQSGRRIRREQLHAIGTLLGYM
ncbi:hypothetical protein ACQPWY_16165 [Pseudonocardia xinjiangensis]|uniref:hypothetical protein n=1 Tax=Pseudonocardia xinjiangensis TaxID=75289 RepID=UPI003D8E52A5